MKVSELRELLELHDGEAEVVIAVKDSQYGLFGYEIKEENIENHPYFENKEDSVSPLTIWIKEENIR